MNTECAHCGASLNRPPSRLAANPHQFCDTRCLAAYQARPVAVVCAICGTPFTVKPSRAAQNDAITCGAACLATLRQRNQVARWDSGDRRQTTCAHCGQPITRKPSQLAMYAANYCNRACKAAAMLGPRPEQVTGRWYPCETCGEDVWRTPATVEAHVFCSRQCAGPHASRVLTGRTQPGVQPRGAASSRWQGGKSLDPYTEGWGRWRSKEIRDRDGNACRACGATDGLIVHHIDLEKVDHSDANLVTLCRPCHAAVHNGKLSVLPTA